MTVLQDEVSARAFAVRISEETPRDRRGVNLLSDALAERGIVAERVEGRDGPYGKTDWEDDLRDSAAVFQQAADHVRTALTSGRRSVVLSTDCSIAIGTFPAVHAARPEAKVVWFDSHSDFDTPVTTSGGFLGCMSLSGACGVWDTGHGEFPLEQAILVGARSLDDDFDIAGQRQAEASALTMVPVAEDTAERVVAAIGGAPVYVHIDPDVLDVSVNPIWYGRDRGFDYEQVLTVLRGIADASDVIGVEMTALHSPDDVGWRRRVTEFEADCVCTLLGVDAPGGVA
ncbi:arginase family protein [Actinomadura sp. NPDC048021]|uniref:arginase family protein n=1 Tax=Actinomadura sp. NPDC048021 TaxID=3155385 RepID=UPI0033E8C2A1